MNRSILCFVSIEYHNIADFADEMLLSSANLGQISTNLGGNIRKVFGNLFIYIYWSLPAF